MRISFLLDGLQCLSFLSIVGSTPGYGSMVTGQLSYCLVWIDTRKNPTKCPWNAFKGLELETDGDRIEKTNRGEGGNSTH